MALRREYDKEICPVARSLEVVGERWTLLIVRDAFYGVQRFTDFRAHLDIPSAVLTERLKLLVDHEILATSIGTSGRDEYLLTPKGEQLWPIVWAMMHWGNEYYVTEELRRPIVHYGCGGQLTPLGNCGRCGTVPSPRDLEVHPRASEPKAAGRDDRVSRLLTRPHRMLEPLTEVA
ncbi:winged helix-turn-helix transcriptional regulator [Mycolicibacterium stellerae]|uniref:winged helix-turn-helix transcriptional regulator n=1 Tax=Mycolicibacterium stellerae TaxID=2358193 RepID=UPI000F0BD5C5|nr:helix-turn-helix domain-containing protein [Mycolicibacterium stellerae]